MNRMLYFIIGVLFIFNLNSKVENKAEIFLTGLVSTGAYDRDGCFSPDMKYFYFSRILYDQQIILKISKDNKGNWKEPKIAEFSGKYRDSSPFISPDGETLFFSSNRPLNKLNIKPKDFDLYFIKKKKNSRWGKVKRFNHLINTTRGEYYPTVSKNGNLYFCTHPETDITKIHIFKSEFKDGKYNQAIMLGNEINSNSLEVTPFIAPDESYLLFTSYRSGNGDIYISNQKEGKWSKAKKLQGLVNSEWRDYCPSVSPDGRYFLFTSNRVPYGQLWKKKRNYKELTTIFRSPGNGLMDIYILKINVNDLIRYE